MTRQKANYRRRRVVRPAASKRGNERWAVTRDRVSAHARARSVQSLGLTHGSRARVALGDEHSTRLALDPVHRADDFADRLVVKAGEEQMCLDRGGQQVSRLVVLRDHLQHELIQLGLLIIRVFGHRLDVRGLVAHMRGRLVLLAAVRVRAHVRRERARGGHGRAATGRARALARVMFVRLRVNADGLFTASLRAASTHQQARAARPRTARGYSRPGRSVWGLIGPARK